MTVASASGTRQPEPPTISTAELHRLLGGSAPLWLVYAPDEAAFGAGHIAGSLTAADAQLRAAIPPGVAVVVYGEGDTAERAGALASVLVADGRNARWYVGGLRSWAAAGLPVERLG